MSKEALVKQGVPAHIVDNNAEVVTQQHQMIFECGGGDVKAKKRMILSSPLTGRTEAFLLKKSPIAVSTGEIVNEGRKPFVWIPGHLPFHVVDPNKIKITCPLRYRLYAEKVEQNVHFLNSLSNR